MNTKNTATQQGTATQQATNMGTKNTATKQVIGTATQQGTKNVVNQATQQGTRQNTATKNTHVVMGGTQVGVEIGKPGIKGVCPVGQIGRFPHATDCTKFIMCANEVGHEFVCPNGLLYDPPTKDCTWPEKANCNPTNINLVGPVTMPPMDKCEGNACQCPEGMIGVEPFCMPDPNFIFPEAVTPGLMPGGLMPGGLMPGGLMPGGLIPDRCQGEGCQCGPGMIGVQPFCMPDPNLIHVGGEVIATDGQQIKGGLSYTEVSSNLMVDVVLTAYITSTATGASINHRHPVELKLRPHSRGGINVTVVAPLMDSPRGGPPNCLSPITPCIDLPGYEALSIQFLSENEKWYLDLSLGAHGHYVVTLYDGYRNNFTFNLPLIFKHSFINDGMWRGEVRLPTEYLPPLVTKFNAFYNYRQNDKQVVESLFPATEASKDPKALMFFQPITMVKIDPENWKGFVPKIWKERAQR